MRVTAAQERALEHISLAMIKEDLTDLPSHALPPGYGLRTYRPGDERCWAEITVSVDEFKEVDRALAYFADEFGAERDKMAERCIFLQDAAGRAIGTTTAWYNACFHGRKLGRIHWVAIRPDCQGRGLAKPLMAAAMERLAELHDGAYLTTQTTSARAIRMYLDFGFTPSIISDDCHRGWGILAAILDHPSLAAYGEACRRARLPPGAGGRAGRPGGRGSAAPPAPPPGGAPARGPARRRGPGGRPCSRSRARGGAGRPR